MRFADYSLPFMFAASVILLLGAAELGYLLAGRFKLRDTANISALQAAIWGLLALMIGFTFAMSLTLFEARRAAVLNEANSITTTALRARLLPSPQEQKILRLLRDYVQIRLDVSRHTPSAEELKVAVSRSNAIQEALWQQAMLATAEHKAMVPNGLFIVSLNEMFDNQEGRLLAGSARLPIIVLMALYGIAAIASAFTGYGYQSKTLRSRVPLLLMCVLVSFVILLIEDLDQPNAGFISVSQQPMLNAAASLATYTH